MRAAQYDRYGAPDVLSEREAADPVARRGHAIIRMESTSVNAVDLAVRAGKLQIATGWSFPKGTGLDVLGTVESVGDGWAGPPVGTRVWGFKPNLPNGRTLAAAERYEVDAGWVAAAPAGGPELGSLPLVASAAYRGLNILGIEAGSTLLIRGAAGGVGAAATQLGVARGALVTALAAEKDLEYVRSIGAEQALDYRVATPDTIRERFDGVLDVVGKDVFAWRRLMNPEGRFATTATSASAAIIMSSLLGRGRIRPIIASPRRDELDALTIAVTAGQLKPQVGATFPLARIADAHRAVPESRGKVLVTI
jgi:NADPH:quinone reductase-like Zn-dependent oxidoreductase